MQSHDLVAVTSYLLPQSAGRGSARLDRGALLAEACTAGVPACSVPCQFCPGCHPGGTLPAAGGPELLPAGEAALLTGMVTLDSASLSPVRDPPSPLTPAPRRLPEQTRACSSVQLLPRVSPPLPSGRAGSVACAPVPPVGCKRLWVVPEALKGRVCYLWHGPWAPPVLKSLPRKAAGLSRPQNEAPQPRSLTSGRP